MHEYTDRIWWYVFAFTFVAVALGETFLPFRSLPSSTPRRWVSNSIMLVVSSGLVALAFQLTGIALAFSIRAASHGALNRVAIPYGVQFAVGFVVLDIVGYFSHRMFHAFGLLWKVHQVHHSETDLDLTTGIRFHPVEALLTQALVLITIASLGPPATAVGFSVLFIVVQDLFTHANLRIPETADGLLRLVIITPAMHRVHHSDVIIEQNTNFGTIFSCWDRLFGTYSAGHTSESGHVRFGLAELGNGSELNAARLIFFPFRRASKRDS
jgi:sterol desaturase/sphingolipid hydroxylase (fatty acid hydroxylase superfamily)